MQYRWLVAATALVTGAGGAAATPLDAANCDRLREEQAALVRDGVKADLAKGPEFAKVNLQPTRIDQIRRYIALEDTIRVRCMVVTGQEEPPAPKEVGAPAPAVKKKAAPVNKAAKAPEGGKAAQAAPQPAAAATAPAKAAQRKPTPKAAVAQE